MAVWSRVACWISNATRAHTNTQKYVILIVFSRLLVVTRTRLSSYFFASFIRSAHSPVQYEIARSLRSFGRCKRSQTHGGVAAWLSGISTWVLLWTSWHWTGFSRSISLCAKSEFRQCSVLSLSVCLGCTVCPTSRYVDGTLRHAESQGINWHFPRVYSSFMSVQCWCCLCHLIVSCVSSK
jgi:hypothetical protein